MFTDVCVVWDGVHVYAARNCAHARTHDELGPIQPPGWTVQSASQNVIKEQHHG